MGSTKKAKKPAKRKAPPKVSKSKLQLINLKVTSKDRKAINALAAKHAGGNYSAWLRHAGLNYRPRKSEVIR